jgi:hypothetical protein
MSLVLPPKVRYLIVCDELLKDATRPGKPIIVGLTSLVRWRGEAEPTILAKMTVFLVLTNGRGVGRGFVRCINEASEEEAFRSGAIPISFVGRDPIGLYGVEFRLSGCLFPAPDTYLVQFLFDDVVVEERNITVR